MSSCVSVRVSRSMSRLEAGVELVAPHAREVVALGVEEELVQQRARVVDRRRLAGALLLEELDERALLGLRRLGVGLDRVADVEAVLEEAEDLLVGRVAHRAQQHGDRQLALAVDADEDLALLVDLELEPRAAGRHEVRDEDLLLAVLGLHEVGARRAHELRDDDALGPVDDERAPLGHPGEVAHEHGLLADLAGLAVDERDGHRQRAGVRQVLLAALLDRCDRIVEVELAEVDGQVARVVLDRRDVGDRLAEAPLLRIRQPLEGAALDVDEVGDVMNSFEAREGAARTRGVYTGQGGDSSRGREGLRRGRRAPRPSAVRRGLARIAQQEAASLRGRSTLTDPASKFALCGRETHWEAATAIGRPRQCSA